VTGPGSRSAEGDRRSSDEIRRSIEQQRDDLDVTAEELRIETYFPADDATESVLRGWAS